MSEFGPEAREFLQSHIDDHGFLSWLGVRVESLDPGHLVMRVPFDDVLTNPAVSGRDAEGRTVHGGVAATLVDTAGGLAVRSSLSNPVSTGVATIDLHVSYLRPATGDLVATADVVRSGGTVGVAEVTVESRVRGGERTDGSRTSRGEQRESDGGESSGARRTSSDERRESDGDERAEVAVGLGSYRIFRD